MPCCQACGADAPTKYVEFYQNIGALVMRFSKSIKGNLCKRCIDEHFWPLTLTTLFLGWWGIISMIVTPFFLLNNIIRYLFALGLESPSASPSAPRLPNDVNAKLQPFAEELITSLQRGTKLEQIAPVIATKAGVTPDQVVAYFHMLATAPAQK